MDIKNNQRLERTSGAQEPSKIDGIEKMISREGGATLRELMQATGWQAHSVRGAIAGALKRRGLVITSSKVEGVRTYVGVQAAE